MPTGFLVVANSVKPFQWRRGVYITFYTTQVHSAFRARWLASSVISQALFTSQPSRRETRNIWSWLHTVESKHIEILLLKVVKRLRFLRLVHIKIDFIWWPALPHVTLWALICMNKRYKLRQQTKRTQSEDLWREFKKARNEVTRQLRTAKALYWKN